MRALALLGLLLGLLAACQGPGPASEPAPWQPLLPGELAEAPFGGGGEVLIEDGTLTLGMGSPLTGVTWSAPVPSGDYELAFTATKVFGNDFFVGLTFPVDDSHLTLVLGGWGGALCGLSCLDGEDASTNETKFFEAFDDGRDYEVRVEVVGRVVRAWIDDQLVVDVDATEREIGLRTEVELSAPLGLATFLTKTCYRNLRWRPLG